MIVLTEQQRKTLIQYVPNAQQLIRDDNLDDLLTELDDVLIDKGMDKEYELNQLGIELQRTYDQIYNQNE